jgi:hypothetical protein
MTSLNSVPDEPFDLFDKDNLYYSEAEFTHGEIEAKHELTAIQLRKPSAGNEWCQLHPGADYTWPVATYTRVSEKGDELYLVPGALRRLFDESVLQPVRLRLAVNSIGTPFIWPMKVNTAPDNRMANHYRALQRISEEAEKTWVKMSKYDFSSRVYHYDVAPDDLGDPRWPAKTMRELVELGFNGQVVDSADHPIVLEYQGRRA